MNETFKISFPHLFFLYSFTQFDGVPVSSEGQIFFLFSFVLVQQKKKKTLSHTKAKPDEETKGH